MQHIQRNDSTHSAEPGTWICQGNSRRTRLDSGLALAYRRLTDDAFLFVLSRKFPKKPTKAEVDHWLRALQEAATKQNPERPIIHHELEETEIQHAGRYHNVCRLRCYFVWARQKALL